MLLTLLDHHSHRLLLHNRVLYWSLQPNLSCPSTVSQAPCIIRGHSVIWWNLNSKIISECFWFTLNNCMLVPHGRWDWQPKYREKKVHLTAALPIQLMIQADFSQNECSSHAVAWSDQLMLCQLPDHAKLSIFISLMQWRFSYTQEHHIA